MARRLRTPRAPRAPKVKKLNLVQRGFDGITRFGASGQAFQRDLAVSAGVITGPFAPVIYGINEAGYRTSLGATNLARSVAGLEPLQRKSIGEVIGLKKNQVEDFGRLALGQAK